MDVHSRDFQQRMISLLSQYSLIKGDRGLTGASSGNCDAVFACPFCSTCLAGVVGGGSSLALVSVRGGGLPRLFLEDMALLLAEDARDRSSQTAVDPFELSPLLETKPSSTRYSSSSASFSV